MSRGPGRIERAIRALFDEQPDLALVTDELAEHCYPDVRPVERKHQIAVLRAAWNVIKNDPDWRAERGEGQGCGWIFFNHGNLQSYALARLISDSWRTGIYHSKKRATRTLMGRDAYQWRPLINNASLSDGATRIIKNGLPYARVLIRLRDGALDHLIANRDKLLHQLETDDRSRELMADERVRADQVRAQVDELRAQLAELRADDAARQAQGLLARLRAAWRGE
jgi:hypothetical protein